MLLNRYIYPRFRDGAQVGKFLVPIKPKYHSILFPEIAQPRPLPLLPNLNEIFLVRRTEGVKRTPGNTIRKVYLCRSKTKALKPGDLLFFYMSKNQAYAASQCVTTIGVVETIKTARSGYELSYLTSRRSVYSSSQLDIMNATPENPVVVIDFLLAAHLSPPITLQNLRKLKIIDTHPPQSITAISHTKYLSLRSHIDLDLR